MNVYSLTFYFQEEYAGAQVFQSGLYIGLFSSREEAEAVETRYRREVRGFKDNAMTARITEMTVLGQELVSEKVYRFNGWNFAHGCKVDVLESHWYSDQSSAALGLAGAVVETPRSEWELISSRLGECEWEDGFSRCGAMFTRNRCFTCFSITGDFDPDNITQLLGLEPYMSWKTGDMRRDGRTHYDFANWQFGFCEEYDVCVENQMRKTIAPLRDKVELLKQICREHGVSLRLEIVPTAYAGDSTPCLAPPADIIDFCHETGTEIDIDLYVYDSEI